MIRVKRYANEGLPLFIASDSEISSNNEGPHGFGLTEEEARQGLLNNEYYRTLQGIRQEHKNDPHWRVRYWRE
jgi:hypothetical protein